MSRRRHPRPVVPASWRWPITVALMAITALALVLNTIAATPILRPEPIDFSLFSRAGGAVLTGQWEGIFASSLIQAGALELIFWGVPFLLGVQGVAGWIAFGVVVGTLFSIALAVLVERLIRPLSPTWSATLAVSATAVAALSGFLTAATSSGHPAEIVIPLLWLAAAALARRGSTFIAGAVLGSTAGWELWGLLGVPVLLLAPRFDLRTVWRSALGGILVVAVLFLPFVVLGPFRMFLYSWTVRPDTLAYLLYPKSLTLAWPLRLAQGLIAVGGGAIVAWLTRRGADAIWLVPLVVCVVRLFMDPVLAGYYAVPPLILVLIGASFSVAHRRLFLFILCLIMLIVLLAAPLSVLTTGVLVILTGVTAVIVVRERRSDRPVDTAA